MKKLLLAMLIAMPAMAHVPVIPPTERKKGDVPPRLEDKPLPPVMAQDSLLIWADPITHLPVVFQW